MSSLSQAPRLEGLSPSHGAFQEHAAHPAKWSAELSSKGSWDACTSHGVSTFLHCAFTAHGLLEVAATAGAMQLAPGATVGVTVGTDIAEPDPAPIGTDRMGAEVRRRVHLARAPPRGHEAWWRSCGSLRAGGGGVLTGVAVRLLGESRKRFGLAAALGQWGCGLRCCRAHGGGVAWPRPMEHEAQPHQGDQHQVVKKEMGDHGKTPSYRSDHYPYRFSKRLATRQPSTSNVKSRRPRHKVRTPGIPSL